MKFGLMVKTGVFLVAIFTQAVFAEDQSSLDAACETARAEKIEPLKQQYIAECTAKKDKTAEQCKHFYRDYGERSGNRPALFYDLPQCVTAFDSRNKNSHRSTK